MKHKTHATQICCACFSNGFDPGTKIQKECHSLSLHRAVHALSWGTSGAVRIFPQAGSSSACTFFSTELCRCLRHCSRSSARRGFRIGSEPRLRVGVRTHALLPYHIAPYAAHRIPHTVRCIPYTMYRIPYTVYSMQDPARLDQTVA